MIDISKLITFRSDAYLSYVRTQPCAVCGRMWSNFNNHAHHTETGGKGIKSSDLTCIPLCFAHHQMLHTIGKESFAHRYGIDYMAERLKCLVFYIMHKNPKKENVREVLVEALEHYIEAKESNSA